MSKEKVIRCSYTPGIYAEGYTAFIRLYNGENSVSGLFTFEWFALIAEKTTFAHWTQVSDQCPLGYLFEKLGLGKQCRPRSGAIPFASLSHCMTKPTKRCAPSKDSDQPGLISVFADHMKKPWVLSYPLSAQRRLIRLGGCPGWSESSLGAYVILLVLSCTGSY